ncbi:MAG: tetratricopeptide repeat protein [Chryseobacterium sp.]|nr:MAG: tetratricopeptide repeat protein [Chryseobacterium sp.]
MKQYLSPLIFLYVFCLLSQPAFGKSYRVSSPVTADTNQVKYYLKNAKQLLFSNPDTALKVLDKARKLSLKLNYAYGEGASLSGIATFYERSGNLNAAQDYNEQAIAVFKKSGFEKGIAATYNGLGIIQGKKGNYKAAAQYFYKALSINEKLHFTEGILQGYSKLGLVNAMSHNYKLAKDYYQKADVLMKDRKSSQYLSLMNNIGQLHAMQGDIKTAYTYFLRGVNAGSDTSNQGSLAQLLTNAGKAAEELGDVKKAYFYHTQALTIVRKVNRPMEEAHLLLNLSSLQFKENPNQIPSRLLEAIALSKKLGDKQLISDTQQNLSEIYKKQGKYKEALRAFEIYNLYRDSLYTLDKKNDLATLQKDFELDKSQLDIKSLQMLNQKQMVIRNIFILLLIAIVSIVFIMFFTIRKTARLNNKLKESGLVKDKMFSILAHDLRSPITNVVQMMESLDVDDNTVEEWRMLFQELKRHAKVSLETLDNLLQWGTAQLQGIRVRPAQIETQVLIDHNISTLKAQADRKKILITNHCSPVNSIYADPVHFDFIIRNLVSNAIKFTYTGGRIDIRCRKSETLGMINFSVQDSGKGISDHEIKHLFSQNLESTKGTDNEKGTGIGLMLCKEFVEANGGSIWVESVEGEGATFHFKLSANAPAS